MSPDPVSLFYGEPEIENTWPLSSAGVVLQHQRADSHHCSLELIHSEALSAGSQLWTQWSAAWSWCPAHQQPLEAGSTPGLCLSTSCKMRWWVSAMESWWDTIMYSVSWPFSWLETCLHLCNKECVFIDCLCFFTEKKNKKTKPGFMDGQDGLETFLCYQDEELGLHYGHLS